MGVPGFITVDHIGFIVGGYGSLGVALYTFGIYKGLPLPLVPIPEQPNAEVEDEVDANLSNVWWSRNASRACRVALCCGLVQLRAIERFFIGGWLYLGIAQPQPFSVTISDRNRIAWALVAGGVVGAYESGYKASWRTYYKSTIAVAGASAFVETLLVILHKKGFFLERPLTVITLDKSPFLYIIGATGAFVVGIFTLSFDGDLYYPQWPEDDNDQQSWGIFKDRVRFCMICLFNFVACKIRIEERFFLGGWISWGVESFLRQVNLENRFIKAVIASGIVGAYFGTYGNTGTFVGSGIGIACLGLVAELLVAPYFSEPQLWQFILPLPSPSSTY